MPRDRHLRSGYQGDFGFEQFLPSSLLAERPVGHTGAVPPPLALQRLCHVNAVVESYERSLAHVAKRWGAVVNFEVPDNGERRAFLCTLGDVIFELVVPNDPTSLTGRGARLARYGNHYDGLEFSVASVDDARRTCQELGLEVIADQGSFFYTSSDDCLGVSWEIFGQDWHELLAPDSAASHGWVPVPPRAHWSDEHAWGLLGLHRISLVVEVLEIAVARLAAVSGAEVLYRCERGPAVADAVGLRVGDTVIELLAPAGEGPVRRFLDRYGERLRATVFCVGDLDALERSAAQQGIDLVEGDAPGTRAIRPADNLGLLFEFTEEPPPR